MKLSVFFRSVQGLLLLALALTGAVWLLVSSDLAYDKLSGTILLAASSLVFYGLIPALIIRFLFKERLGEYGFSLPVITKRTLGIFALALGALAIPPIFFHGLPGFRGFYSLSGESFSVIVLFLGPLSLACYLGEEFFFRGFLTFALYRRIGRWAFPLLMTLFAYFHIGKPLFEVGYSAFAALMLSWLSLTSKSFLPAVLIHFVIAFWFIVALSI